MKKQVLIYALTILSMNAVIVQRAQGSCNTPSNFSTGGITQTSVNFDWTPEIGALYYRVQYHKTGSSVWVTGTTATTSFVATGLTPNVPYEAQVQTVCASGSSQFSDIRKFSTLSQIIAPPSAVNSSFITLNSAWLSWSSIPGTCSYNLQWKLTSSSTWTTVTPLQNSSFMLSGLTSCTSYQVRVGTFCTTGSSAYSTPVTFITSCPVSTTHSSSSSRMIKTDTENPVHIALYPNPVRENLTIEYNSSASGIVTENIYNILGKNVMNTVITVDEGKNVLNLNTTTLPDGIYFYELENNGELLRSKFMISK